MERVAAIDVGGLRAVDAGNYTWDENWVGRAET